MNVSLLFSIIMKVLDIRLGSNSQGSLLFTAFIMCGGGQMLLWCKAFVVPCRLNRQYSQLSLF